MMEETHFWTKVWFPAFSHAAMVRINLTKSKAPLRHIRKRMLGEEDILLFSTFLMSIYLFHPGTFIHIEHQ